MILAAERKLGPYEIGAHWVRAGWAKCTARGMRV